MLEKGILLPGSYTKFNLFNNLTTNYNLRGSLKDVSNSVLVLQISRKSVFLKPAHGSTTISLIGDITGLRAPK